MPVTSDWNTAASPSLVNIEALAIAAWERLPAEFRDMCLDLVIRVEDFAPEEILSEFDLETPFELLGLYQGTSLDRKSNFDMVREPDVVFLYRRAILDYWADGEEPLGKIVAHVLVHEVGHHFGFSDADMEEIEAAAIT
jgi:predicted Zn-dependent protease with MMP-like domain